jgi:succinate dehydrogenase/fumarate reductase-like Fe-S protein
MVTAYEGETVGAVMFVLDRIALRRTRRESAPRGVYCGMGVCYDCLVTVNGTKNLRACTTQVSPGMKVETSADNESDGAIPEQKKQCDEC